MENTCKAYKETMQETVLDVSTFHDEKTELKSYHHNSLRVTNVTSTRTFTLEASPLAIYKPHNAMLMGMKVHKHSSIEITINI